MCSLGCTNGPSVHSLTSCIFHFLQESRLCQVCWATHPTRFTGMRLVARWGSGVSFLPLPPPLNVPPSVLPPHSTPSSHVALPRRREEATPPPRRTKHGQSIPCSCPYLHQLPSLSHSFSKTRIITASSKNSKFPNLLGLSPVKISGPVDGSQYTSWTLVETECSLPQKKKCKKERGR